MAVAKAGDEIEASRRLILEEIGTPPDLTFVRVAGNLGDELIWAGTRELLGDRIYTEVGLEEMCGVSGHTALLCGGGAFCRSYHEQMPRALAIAELRFERVIVLPSSFDPSEDVVREALARTRAVVFAREAYSYRRITALCDARLAHDCSFFFDYSPYRREGHGELNAFRTDREARDDRPPPPPDNVDISVTASTLEEWLEAIAARELVRTDRAHVMIAGAMLGKSVEFATGPYHKLRGIAQYSLGAFDVTELESAPAPLPPPATHRTPPGRRSAPKVTAIIVTRDRPSLALRAIDSLSANDCSLHTVLLDNNSAPARAAALARACAERPEMTLRCSDRNLRCGGGRRTAAGLASGEHILFLDDDAELAPGALDALVAELDSEPSAAAVTATVQLPDATVQHSGGWFAVSGGVADFTPIAAGEALAVVPPSGAADWAPGTAVLVRREALERFPIDEQMAAYENHEWCYRLEQACPGSFRRSREAIAVHRAQGQLAEGSVFAIRSGAIDLLAAQARFYERHGVLLGPYGHGLIPELHDGRSERDVQAARMLMELLLAKGAAWALMQWINGGLDSLLGPLPELRALRLKLAEIEAEAQEEEAKLEFLYQRHLTLERIEAEAQEQEAKLEFLYQRHLTLERIEHGGWWRLRHRALPLLRLYWGLVRRGDR